MAWSEIYDGGKFELQSIQALRKVLRGVAKHQLRRQSNERASEVKGIPFFYY